MKHLIIVVIAIFTLNSFAQETPTTLKGTKTTMQEHSPEVSAKIESKKLTKQLDLNPEQSKQVYEVMLEYFTENKTEKAEIRQNISSEEKTSKSELKEEVMAQKKAENVELSNKLKKIFTDEQFEAYLEYNKTEKKTRKKVVYKKN